jgi:FKBP-type peptidyl-prolyl cis-trans isomerase
MVMWRVIAPGLVGMMICGCQPPAGIIPAAPPGIEVERKAPDSEQPAEALGEAVTRPVAKTGASASTAKPEIADLKPATPTAKGETKTTASGVKYETLQEGTGAEAKPGQRVELHYTGTLENGTMFDSSRSREPFSFTVGKKPFEVIVGWEEGVVGMKVGERRKLTIPANLGYGEREMGKIPPNSTLIFDVELISVAK